MTHIERMEEERNQLHDKIESACKFLDGEMENPKFTDEPQRMALWVQINYMMNYKEVLEGRIGYDKLKNKAELESN